MVSEDSRVYEIRVRGGNIRFLCGSGEFVLEAMKRDGRGPIHYGCFGGGCGVCKIRVISGAYLVAKKMSRAHVSEEEERSSVVLGCCVKPLGDLLIESIKTI